MNKEVIIPVTDNEIYDWMQKNIAILYESLKKYGVEYDDEAYSVGYIAMYNACKSYNTAHKAKLSSWVTLCVNSRVGARRAQLACSKNSKCISMSELLSRTATGVVADIRESERLDSLCASSEDIQELYEIKEKYNFVVTTLKELIGSLEVGSIKRNVLESWYLKHDCDATNAVIAAEAGCSIAYVRKVKKETAAIILSKLKKEEL